MCLCFFFKVRKLPAVDVDAFCYKKDATYRGTASQTVSGKTCQCWESQAPHEHSRTPENYPYEGLKLNYCRKFDGEVIPWCYTNDLKTRWEYCNIPACKE
uniref:Kringle domain-containing protein n=1 Tax=Callorhinchus milii TaxID=7868 RepID=A0A4W3H335_CALMI